MLSLYPQGYVAEIRTGVVRHLVAIIKGEPAFTECLVSLDLPRLVVPPSGRVTGEGDESDTGSWHLFNDFVVQKIPEDEALSFPGKWKVTHVCQYFEHGLIEREGPVCPVSGAQRCCTKFEVY